MYNITSKFNNMKVLIVENDSNKYDQVKSFLIEELKIIETNISIRKSYQSGLESILDNTYDFIILDMSIPTFDITEFDDGGNTLDRGGEIILQEMERENISIPSIILTQYEDFDNVSLLEIDSNLKEEFEEFYLGCIYYNISEENWKNELNNLYLKIEK